MTKANYVLKVSSTFGPNFFRIRLSKSLPAAPANDSGIEEDAKSKVERFNVDPPTLLGALSRYAKFNQSLEKTESLL